MQFYVDSSILAYVSIALLKQVLQQREKGKTQQLSCQLLLQPSSRALLPRQRSL